MECGIGPSEIPNQLNEQSEIQTHLKWSLSPSWCVLEIGLLCSLTCHYLQL
jgi:hypothetical protein